MKFDLFKHKRLRPSAAGAPAFEVPPNVYITNTDPTDASWAKSGLSFAQDTTGPDGAPAWTATTSSVSRHTGAPQIAGGAACHNMGFVVKAGTNTWFCIGNGVNTIFAVFDLTLGTIASNTWDGAAIHDMGSGWYYCSIYSAAGGLANSYFRSADSQAHATSGAYVSNGATMILAQATAY